jgi:hypothetical protein
MDLDFGTIWRRSDLKGEGNQNKSQRKIRLSKTKEVLHVNERF